MKPTNLMFRMLLILSAFKGSFAYAGGGDHGGQGGRTKYGDQFFTIARQLQPLVGSEYSIRDIISSSISVRPSKKILKADGNVVHLLSYIESKGKARLPTRIKLKSGELRVIEVNEKEWDKMNCRSKHLMVFHELLVQLEIEKTQDYHVSSAKINELDQDGKIECNRLTGLDDLPVTGPGIRSGCPASIVEAILDGSKEISSASAFLLQGIDRNLWADQLKIDRDGDYWNQELPKSLIEQSARALSVNYLARLCLDFMDPSHASPVVNLAMKRMQLANQTMVELSEGAMKIVQDSMKPLVNLGISYSKDLLSEQEYEKEVAKIGVLAQNRRNLVNNMFEVEYARHLENIQINRLGLKLRGKIEAYQFYYSGVQASETTKALIKVATEYNASKKSGPLF